MSSPLTYRIAASGITSGQRFVPFARFIQSGIAQVFVVSDSRTTNGVRTPLPSAGATATTQYGCRWGWTSALMRHLPLVMPRIMSAGESGGSSSGPECAMGFDANVVNGDGATVPGTTLGDYFNIFPSNATKGFQHSFSSVADDTTAAASGFNTSTLNVEGCLPVSGSVDVVPGDWDGCNIAFDMQYGVFDPDNYITDGTITSTARYFGSTAITLSPASASLSMIGSPGAGDSLAWKRYTFTTANWSAATAAGLSLEFRFNPSIQIQGPAVFGYCRWINTTRTAGVGGASVLWSQGSALTDYLAAGNAGDGSGINSLTTLAADNFIQSCFRQSDLLGQDRYALIYIDMGTNDSGTPTTAAAYKASLASAMDTIAAHFVRNGVKYLFLLDCSMPQSDAPADTSGNPLREFYVRQYLTAQAELAVSRSDTIARNWTTGGSMTVKKTQSILGYNSDGGTPIPSSTVGPHASRYGVELSADLYLGGLLSIARAYDVDTAGIRSWGIRGR